MKGTKLWQSAGSPIIQGRSRTERPFIQDWLIALFGATALGVSVFMAMRWPAEAGWEIARQGGQALVQAVAFGIAPCALVVWVSRTLRAGRPWIVGSVVIGGLLAFVLVRIWSLR